MSAYRRHRWFFFFFFRVRAGGIKSSKSEVFRRFLDTVVLIEGGNAGTALIVLSFDPAFYDHLVFISISHVLA